MGVFLGILGVSSFMGFVDGIIVAFIGYAPEWSTYSASSTSELVMGIVVSFLASIGFFLSIPAVQ